MEHTLKVSVPAESGFVALLRSVVASAAGHLGLSFDDIEDLRLAVNEACADLLELQPGGTILHLDLVADDGEVAVLVWSNAQTPEWPRTDTHDRLAWRILRSLTDEATMLRHPDGPAIRLIKRRPSRGSG
jgi:serine/threonine-protein kinase RsbW